MKKFKVKIIDKCINLKDNIGDIITVHDSEEFKDYYDYYVYNYTFNIPKDSCEIIEEITDDNNEFEKIDIEYINNIYCDPIHISDLYKIILENREFILSLIRNQKKLINKSKEK